MKSFLEEFKAFIMRGNVIDLAVGVVIGTQFNNITTSLVNNVMTPPLGLLTGQINFEDLAVNLGGNVNIQYGLFIQAVVSFLITAFAIFLLIKFVTRLRKISVDNSATEPAVSKSPELLVLEEIRDSLKNSK